WGRDETQHQFIVGLWSGRSAAGLPDRGRAKWPATAARGASGLTDGVRWQANLDKQDDRRMAFRIVKSNFTAIPTDFRIRKEDDGTLSYDQPIEPVSKTTKSLKEYDLKKHL
ncbi:MAG: hypothetical protein V4487_05450, partial [Chlamydiota bacterium]